MEEEDPDSRSQHSLGLMRKTKKKKKTSVNTTPFSDWLQPVTKCIQIFRLSLAIYKMLSDFSD